VLVAKGGRSSPRFPTTNPTHGMTAAASSALLGTVWLVAVAL
jgi:hypothetical protein